MSLFENKERREELEKLLYFQSFGQNFRKMCENWSLSVKRSEMINELVDGCKPKFELLSNQFRASCQSSRNPED